ncbi:MAG: tRNA1(Val) (adenine(37)-N6)-methyltransferase, partial [Alphaproteobacteria bacterium]
TDPVFVAAAVNANAGQNVLELGCGAGTALACLCHRVNGLSGYGLELQSDYADLARRNATENNLDMTIHTGSLLNMPNALRDISFDHAFANPPFYDPSATSAPDNAGRDLAHREGEAQLGDWVTTGLRRLKPRGYFTIIHRAERLADILSALHGKAGDIRILPLAARDGREAGRVIVRARKGAAGPLKLLAPMTLHQGRAHTQDQDSFLPEVRKVLRNAQPIVM